MRALKILVVVMGVLIVAGTATLAVLLIRRAGGDAAPQAPTASALLRQLDEPSGTSIAAIALSPDRLAIHLRMAIRQGWTEEELREAILHLSVYVGLPLVREALLTARDTFAAIRGEA